MTLDNLVDRNAFTAEFLEKGRFSKSHFTEDLQIYEAIQETGDIDILCEFPAATYARLRLLTPLSTGVGPKRNGSIQQAINCDDEGFLDFLHFILKINPVDRPYAADVRIRAGNAQACYGRIV